MTDTEILRALLISIKGRIDCELAKAEPDPEALTQIFQAMVPTCLPMHLWDVANNPHDYAEERGPDWLAYVPAEGSA